MRGSLNAILISLAFCNAGIADERDPVALELPDSDIFLFPFIEDEQGARIAGDGRNITERPGYDNQPWFTPGGKTILYTANHVPDRTDVFEYEILGGGRRQLTDSVDQEYSPQMSPNNKTLSYVTDGPTANQSIWSMDRGDKEHTWLLAHLDEREPVGYYAWNHRTQDLLFWSRYGFSLRLVNTAKKESHYITGNAPPTSPQIIPNSDNFSFVHRQGNSEVWVKELDPRTRAVRPVARISGSNYHYGWTPKGRIVMAQGDKLRCWSGEKDDWSDAADLKELGVRNASRVVISQNGKWIAIVGLPTD